MHLNKIVASLAVALPLLASAQTPAVTPADQPRSNLEKQQTTENGNAPKYGTPSSATTTSTQDAAAEKGKAKRMKSDGAKAKTTTGDPATDATSTKDATTTK